jgi:uncharacterized protein YfaS (alpha-2-macroglobulin family)
MGRVSNSVTFDIDFQDKMVEEREVGKTLGIADFPFTVTPAIQAEGKWMDQQRFSASLLAPLEMATSYTAKIKEGLKTSRGNEIKGEEYVFQTDPLKLLSVRAVGTRNGEADIQFDFNIPVSPTRLRGFLSINSFYSNSPPPQDIRGSNIRYHLSGTASETLHAMAYIGNSDEMVFLNVGVIKGLTGEVGDLGLTESSTYQFKLSPTLRIESLNGRNSYEGPHVQVRTSRSVRFDESVKSFIKVEPEIPFSIDSYYAGSFNIRGDFKPRERFTFTFKKGLPSQNGSVLQEDHTQAVIMPDLEPSIELPAPGMFLSPVAGGLVPVELVNISKLKIDLWRLYENNIPYLMRGEYTYFQRDLARRVASKEFQLSLPFNEKTRRGISLDDLLSNDQGGNENRGLFLLSLSIPGTYWNERDQIVNLSDLGAVARLWEDGILMWVNTLSGLEPVERAEVRVYSNANQLLAEGKTGPDGVWHLQRDTLWEKDQSRSPYLATISKGQDVTFVKLTRGLLSQETFDTSGRPWLREGYDAAIFSARDIYRTGEEASFKAVVRHHDLSTPDAFPVLFVVHDPLGRAAKRGIELLSEEGGALFNLELPSNAITGAWNVALFIPGNEDRPLASMSFSVEDFAPPRIEVHLNTDVKSLFPDQEASFDISARYLFGADGTGLRWESTWSAREGVFTPKQSKWAPYVFKDEARQFTRITDEAGSDNLHEKGEGGFSLTLPDNWNVPVVDVSITGRVMEEGGRWVSDGMVLPFYPLPWILGLAAPEENLLVGKNLTFRVAALTPKEEPADPGKLTATLYHVRWNYNLVELDGYTRWQSSEEFNKIESKTVSLTEGVGTVSFKPPRWGTYVVRVQDGKDKVSASIRFYTNDPSYADRGSQLLDRVEIDLDKELYKVGDVAKATLRAPFKGLLLFGVEGMGPIERKILSVDSADTVVEFPVTAKMTPNAWCTVWLIRPVTESETWSSHRAVGVKVLKVDTSTFRLNVELTASDKVDPATKLPITLTLTDVQGMPAKGEVALALVDDAVLRLTDFKVPDLLDHFLGKRQINSEGYDIYDLLMPLESRNTELLHPSGGMALDAFAGAAVKARRFKILSLFDGLLSADVSGVVKVELDLPEFSGRGRLFAVATSGPRFGVTQQTVQIARDIVAEADLPRFAAPGDAFTVPLTVFNSSEEPKDITVELSTEGELLLEASDKPNETNTGQPYKLTGTVLAGESRKWAVTLKALEPGEAVYVVKTLWQEGGQDKVYEQRIDMPVRSPYPVITLSGSGSFASGDARIQVREDSFLGATTGKLVFSDTPLVDLTKATSFLASYPYGCLEQTLSSAWPFLVLPDAIAEIDPLLVNSTAVKLKTDYALTRLQSMQLYDGSFAKWPGDATPYNWGGVYATHFLVEARKAGVDYPEGMLVSAVNWLKQFLASMPGSGGYKYRERDDFTTKAYAVYVLALNGEKPLGWMQYLGENKEFMWPSGRIWLAGAYALTEGKADVLRELGNWNGDLLEPEALYETLESNVRNAAQLLSIWAEIEPKSPEAVKLVQTLLNWGKQNQWYSTQENATVTMALARYVTRAGYEKSQLEGVLKYGEEEGEEKGKEKEEEKKEEKKIASFRSGEKTSLEVADLPASPLTLSVMGTGRGYYAWSVTGMPSKAPSPERKGLILECHWANRKGETLPLSAPLEQGTEILATLTLSPSLPLNDVVISYLLPGGLELENPRLRGDEEEEEQETQGVHYDARDDRLLIFIDHLTQATEYKFTMRAVTRGNFAVPPLAAEGMYDPDIRFVGSVGENLEIR